MAGDPGPRDAERDAVSPTRKGVEMRLFNRKTRGDVARRCTSCRERLPDGAHECAMCGAGVGAVDPGAERGLENASPDDTRRRRRLGNGAGLA